MDTEGADSAALEIRGPAEEPPGAPGLPAGDLSQ